MRGGCSSRSPSRRTWRTRPAAREGRLRTDRDTDEAIARGAVKRARPTMRTLCATFMGLLPILWSTSAVADVMKHRRPHDRRPRSCWSCWCTRRSIKFWKRRTERLQPSDCGGGVAGPGCLRGCLESEVRCPSGPTGRENGAQGIWAAGRCPGWRDDNAVRPERPREGLRSQSFELLEGKFSRPFRPQGWGALFPRASAGLRPQMPWAGISRPVGPVGRFSGRLLGYFVIGPYSVTRAKERRRI